MNGGLVHMQSNNLKYWSQTAIFVALTVVLGYIKVPTATGFLSLLDTPEVFSWTSCWAIRNGVYLALSPTEAKDVWPKGLSHHVGFQACCPVSLWWLFMQVLQA